MKLLTDMALLKKEVSEILSKVQPDSIITQLVRLALPVIASSCVVPYVHYSYNKHFVWQYVYHIGTDSNACNSFCRRADRNLL